MGYYVIGAINAAPTKQSQFQAIADAAYAASPHKEMPWVMVRVEDDGTSKTYGIETEDAAKGGFSAVTAQNPGSALVALYQKGGDPALFDVAYRAPRVVTNVATTQSAAGWIAAGVAGLFGLMVVGGRKKRVY